MLKKIYRVVITVFGMLIGLGFFNLMKYLISFTTANESIELTEVQLIGIEAFIAIIFGIIFFRLEPSVSRQSQKVANNIEMDLKNVSNNTLLSSVIGLIVGFIFAFLLSKLYEFITIPYISSILSIVSYVVLGYLGVVIARARGTDVLVSFTENKKLISVGGKEKKNNLGCVPKIFDTSVIIDGRVLDIMRAGFLEGNIIIPEFVLVELQHIADSSDSLKRTRGRRGLDILKQIQTDYGIEIYNTNSEKALDEIPEVDIKLVKLSQMLNGKVVTNDFNLNKVAKIKDVDVLNINELANMLKPVVLPGETMNLLLVKEGKEKEQALAYLDDGTMIVVEGGRRYIGKTINVVVSTVLQTAAGRMIFGKPER